MSEKSRIKVEIVAMPTDTKVIGTVRFGTRSERNAATPKVIADKSGIAKEFFIRIPLDNYIIPAIGVRLQVRK